MSTRRSSYEQRNWCPLSGSSPGHASCRQKLRPRTLYLAGPNRGESPLKVHDLVKSLPRPHRLTATVQLLNMAVKFDLPFTQTSTIVAFLITLLIAVALSPIGRLDLGRDELVATLLRLAHLFSFAAWLGSQIWVTFFAGE